MLFKKQFLTSTKMPFSFFIFSSTILYKKPLIQLHKKFDSTQLDFTRLNSVRLNSTKLLFSIAHANHTGGACHRLPDNWNATKPASKAARAVWQSSCSAWHCRAACLAGQLPCQAASIFFLKQIAWFDLKCLFCFFFWFCSSRRITPLFFLIWI